MNIAQPDELTSSVTGTNTLCNGDSNGGVDLTVNGGTAPYTYGWSNGTTTEDVGSLAAGNYTVQIIDDHGCITFDLIDIFEPALLQVSLTQQNVSCYNGSDGSIDITPTGGTQPYSYNWTPDGQTTEDLSGIAFGSNNVVVTDNNGCTVGIGTTITQPDSMVYDMSSTPASCYGYSDGTASVNVVSGGTAPFSYSWNTNPGQGNATANGLAIGTYKVTITDDNNCLMVGSVSVTQPDTLIPTIVDIDSVVCSGDSDGAVDITVIGGNGGYTYVWNDVNGTQTQDLQGVPTGTYTVIITDAKGCIGTVTAFIGEPEALVIIRILKGQTCPGFNDAWAEVQVSGGIEPYTYYWSTGQTGDVANNLYAGTYSVSVLDKNGCVAIKQQIDIINYEGVVADFLADPYEVSILNPEIEFYDSSKSAVQIVSWDWDFGDGAISTLTNPMHEYTDTGYFPVTLLVINEFGCADTIVDTIRIKPEAAIYIPNAFTPDGNGLNDMWGAKTFGLTEFELYVYDRWGEMIFRTDNPNDLWNGRRDNVGAMSPDGVYPYLIKAKDHTGRAHRYVGHVVLLK
ncbi:MAG: gliding motility-associated C-terminal domain-containing protein [Bacteroidia bacterium]|nr:gliding motility-associated C-terminal domain-containing protein [Bacteroidia bacterium]